MVKVAFSGAKARLRRCAADESGAVTADWVVLIGAIVTMTFVVMASITGGVNAFGNNTEAGLAARAMGTSSAPG